MAQASKITCKKKIKQRYLPGIARCARCRHMGLVLLQKEAVILHRDENRDAVLRKHQRPRATRCLILVHLERHCFASSWQTQDHLVSILLLYQIEDRDGFLRYRRGRNM